MKKKSLVGWIFTCELKDFKKDAEFTLPSPREIIKDLVCDCNIDKHEIIKVRITIEEVK